MSAPLFQTGDSVAVLGAGRSGVAAAKLLIERGARVAVFDTSQSEKLRKTAGELEALGAACSTGDQARNAPVGDFRLVVLSPGIDPATEFVSQFADAGVPLISEIELASRFCAARIVAITGTNGKTTTTGLTESMLVEAGIPAVACGNIGEPFSEALLRAPDSGVFVVEVSSFQLEACDTFRPHVAVWTNFSPNHLDRYPGEEEYYQAKARIFRNQTSEDFAVVQKGSRLPEFDSYRITFSSTDSGADFTLDGGFVRFRGQEVLDCGETNLPGAHNAENLMAALGTAHCLGVDFEPCVRAARSFRPAAHRCEPVAEINGVLFVNDSKSTNLDALTRALEAQNREVILIVGGKDKGFGFESVRELVASRASGAVLIGEMRERIVTAWDGAVPCHPCEGLEEAVFCAWQLAKPGMTVLFSPGTSSFDMFRDYEARGEAFRSAVWKLSQSPPQPKKPPTKNKP